MNIKHLILLPTLAVFLATTGLGRIAQAEPLPDTDVANQLAALHAAVDRMQDQLRDLRKLVPSFTGFMPEFSERFHVMHAAGDAGDWAVADHEILELQRLVGVASVVDPEKGQLFSAFMTPSLAELKTAIQHTSDDNFDKALANTVANCNACHTAAGSAFIKVSLDVPMGMSMRHPHLFSGSKAMTQHAHGH